MRKNVLVLGDSSMRGHHPRPQVGGSDAGLKFGAAPPPQVFLVPIALNHFPTRQ